MRSVFLGKPIHWLVLAVIVAVLWWMGDRFTHTRDFNLFVVVLLAIGVLVVVVVKTTTRPDEQVTRDPFDEHD